MGRNLQLRINEPCHENWEKMEVGEGGRFCGACSKVVVDFSVMSDREILQYLSRKRDGVCGFLSGAKGMNEEEQGTMLRRSSGAEQLDRDMLLGEEGRRRKWMGWGVLVAGLLFGSRGLAQQRPPRVEMHQAPVEVGGSRVEVGGRKGEIEVKVDSFKVLPAVTVVGYGVVGKLTTTRCFTTVESKSIVDSLKKKVMDSVAFLGLLGKKELGVYPNPVRRGTVVSLSWKVEPGRYQVGLFNSAGALLEQELLEVKDGRQVDLFEIPAVLPGGVYFLRAVKAGSGKEITKKIVVI